MKDTERFLRDELFSLTLMATVQRGKVYAEHATEAQKRLFQRGLQEALENASRQYATRVSDKRHLRNISSLSAKLTGAFHAFLRNGRFRIGSAQKALNLFLKYLWCTGLIPTPPHCPFDFQIIQKLPTKARRNWTTIDSIGEYKSLVAGAKKQADGQSLAEWELQLYSEVTAKQ